MRTVRAPASSVLAVALLAASAAGGDPPPSPLAGADAKARIALAQELKKKDALALAHALNDLGASKAKDADRDFLVQYAAQERDRALRIMALEAAARLDRKGAADWFKAHADGKEELPTIVALEALGYLGAKDDVGTAVDLLKSPNEWIGVAAATAAARLGTGKDVETIAENGLSNPSEHVTDHAAWAVQDILKKLKPAVEVFEKYAGKKSDPRAVRAGSTVASLQDKRAYPQVWGDGLKLAPDLVFKAPASVEIKTQNADWKTGVGAALDWLKKNMPGAELMLRAATKRIEVPGVKQPQDWVDPADDAILVPADRAAWPANKLALHLHQMATVLWEKRLGEPYKGHRGWEAAIFDSYDLCVIARLYDAGPGGITRATYMKDQIEKHPWGSQ
jgi:hypothetical protein